jgi:hypothetical protein
MKHLTTLLTMAITLTGMAQQMPYNPDANGDDFVGVDDVLGVLGVYDTALMQPDLQCDYEGTDLEQLFGDWISGAIVVDSIYIEYTLVDTVESFYPNCPDAIIEELVLERSYMLNDQNEYISGSGQYYFLMTNYLGYHREVGIAYDYSNGFFDLWVGDEEIPVVSAGAFSNWVSPWGGSFMLPFAGDWELTSDGIQVSWEPGTWPAVSQNFRLIPFWHEAE